MSSFDPKSRQYYYLIKLDRKIFETLQSLNLKRFNRENMNV